MYDKRLDANKIKIKESLDVTKIFIKNEVIKLEDIRKRIKTFYDNFFLYFEYKRMFPSFESEYFYYILIKYLLETFDSLYDYEFLEKIILHKNLSRVTKKIKNKTIKDDIIIYYYYFAMAEEYYLEGRILNLFRYLGSNTNLNFKYDKYSIEENLVQKQIIIRENNKIIRTIENYDYYILFKEDIIDIIEDENYYFNSDLYSLKGYLINYEFKKEIGDKYWELFLNSKLVVEILENYYSNIDSKLFEDKK